MATADVRAATTIVPNAAAWEWFRKMGSPKLVVAPMVDQSELPFRLLCRRHGADLAVTPMFHSRNFSLDSSYRKRNFQTNAEDRPLLVQFCGNDPETLLAAAKFVEKDCDGVDINLGCPQGIARKGHYGAFLLKELDLLERIVKHLSSNLSVPVTCKIRILDTKEATLKLVKTLEGAGCSLLTVHGRTIVEKKQLIGNCNWEMIKFIRENVSIPVIANGGIETVEDMHRCIAETGVAGVMTSEAVLENPYMFEGQRVTGASQDALVAEYIRICREVSPNMGLKCVRAHLFKFLFTGLMEDQCLQYRNQLGSAKSFEEIEAAANAVAEVRKHRRGTPEDIPRTTWYTRHLRKIVIAEDLAAARAAEEEAAMALGENANGACENRGEEEEEASRQSKKLCVSGVSE